jgi:hypothetical protein
MKPDHRPDWARRRGSLSHDWLKHQIMPLLAAAYQAARGEVMWRDEQREDLRGRIGEWQRRNEELKVLLESFSQEMSAAGLVKSGPLSHRPEDHILLLESVIHERWVARIGPAELVSSAEKSVKRASEALGELERWLERPKHPNESLDPSDIFRKAYEACNDLTDALGDFPGEIILP